MVARRASTWVMAPPPAPIVAVQPRLDHHRTVSDGASDTGATLEDMRGIVGWGVHLPYRRLERAQIAALVGAGGGKGSRTVASYDEDTTTMAVQAARDAVRSTGVV